MAVTTNVASEKVAEALDNAKDLAGRARDQTLDYAKAPDEAMHEHPYRAMGIAFGIGALLACLFMRQRSRGCN